MQLTIDIRLPEGDEGRLAQILECDPDALPATLNFYATAAAHEYIEMVLGRAVFNRGSDIREFRLMLLVMHALEEKLPDESTVSRLFQTSTSESRALIRSMMSKYQYRLTEALSNSARSLLTNAQIADDESAYYEVVINNKNMVEMFNQKLAEKDGTLSPIRKKRGSVSTYEIYPASYDKLLEVFPGV